MESAFVQAGEVRLQYYHQGHGAQKILLVHGYASSARLWQLTMELLDPDKFEVFATNNRGAGDSDRSPTEEAYSVEQFAQDVHNAAEALGLNGFTLVGHSMGGATVAQYAMAHQQKLNGLVLLNSAPLGGRTLEDGWDEAIREQFRTNDRPQGDMGFNGPHITPEFTEGVLADIARNPVERALGGRRSMSQLRLRERLSKITVPTLVVGGDKDTTVGVDNILADYLALPEASRSLHIFHGIGHSPNVEIPDRLAALLTRFVGEVSVGEKVAAATG